MALDTDLYLRLLPPLQNLAAVNLPVDALVSWLDTPKKLAALLVLVLVAAGIKLVKDQSQGAIS